MNIRRILPTWLGGTPAPSAQSAPAQPNGTQAASPETPVPPSGSSQTSQALAAFLAAQGEPPKSPTPPPPTRGSSSRSSAAVPKPAAPANGASSSSQTSVPKPGATVKATELLKNNEQAPHYILSLLNSYAEFLQTLKGPAYFHNATFTQEEISRSKKTSRLNFPDIGLEVVYEETYAPNRPGGSVLELQSAVLKASQTGSKNYSIDLKKSPLSKRFPVCLAYIKQRYAKK